MEKVKIHNISEPYYLHNNKNSLKYYQLYVSIPFYVFLRDYTKKSETSWTKLYNSFTKYVYLYVYEQELNYQIYDAEQNIKKDKTEIYWALLCHKFNSQFLQIKFPGMKNYYEILFENGEQYNEIVSYLFNTLDFHNNIYKYYINEIQNDLKIKPEKDILQINYNNFVKKNLEDKFVILPRSVEFYINDPKFRKYKINAVKDN